MRNKGTVFIFGRAGLRTPTPLIIKAIFGWIKRVSMAVAVTGVVSSHEFWAMGFMSIAWFVDEIQPLFGETQKPPDAEDPPTTTV